MKIAFRRHRQTEILYRFRFDCLPPTIFQSVSKIHLKFHSRWRRKKGRRTRLTKRNFFFRLKNLSTSKVESIKEIHFSFTWSFFSHVSPFDNKMSFKFIFHRRINHRETHPALGLRQPLFLNKATALMNIKFATRFVGKIFYEKFFSKGAGKIFKR